MKSLEQLSHFLKQYEDDNSTTSDDNSQTAKKYPPVDQWNPTEHLELDIVIKANGEWWYEGNKMTRPKLVSLFASILVVEDREDNDKEQTYFLKTPVQKVKITVEDAPLLITDVAIISNNNINSNTNAETESPESYLIEFRTNTDDVIRLDESHTPYFQRYQSCQSYKRDESHSQNDEQDEMRLYIFVRNGLHALISRPVYYHLMELGELIERDGQTLIQLVSNGQNFEVLYPES